MGQTTRHHWAMNIKHLHHPLTVCIRQTHKLGRRVLVSVLVGLLQLLDPLFVQIFNTTTIEMPVCNGPQSVGDKHNLFTPSILQQSVLGRTCRLTSMVWVFIGLLQLLVPLFDQIFTRSIEFSM
jgi:hypothetical protein